MRRMREVRADLSGQGNHNEEGEASNRPESMHSLLLLSGILSKRCNAGRPSCNPEAAREINSVPAKHEAGRINHYSAAAEAAEGIQPAQRPLTEPDPE